MADAEMEAWQEGGEEDGAVAKLIDDNDSPEITPDKEEEKEEKGKSTGKGSKGRKGSKGNRKGKGSWEAPPGFEGETQEWRDGGDHTDLYLAELPGNWGDEEITKLHVDARADEKAISVIKILPQKSPKMSTRSAIVKYVSHDAAAAALDLISGRSVTSDDGQMSLSIVARFATSSKKWEPARSQWNISRRGIPVSVGLRVHNKKNWRSGKVTAFGSHPGSVWVQFDDGDLRERDISNFESEDGWELEEVEMVSVATGLRVRNSQTWRPATITWVSREKPGFVWLRFDDGEQRERPIANFETEDGLPLMISAPGSVTMRPGLRIRNWKNGRTGVIDEVLIDGRMRIAFDDGDSGIRNTENFESRDGRRLRPVQGGFSTASRPAYQQNREYGGAASNGWGWGDQRNGSWKGEKGWGSRGTWKGGDGRQTRSVGERQGSQPRRRKRIEDADPELVKSALQEVTDQLTNPKYEGRVWIDNWPGRFQPQLGLLRDFLESRPDLFKVVRKGDRAYAVTLVEAGEGEDGKPVVAEGVHDPDEGADDAGEGNENGEEDDEDESESIECTFPGTQADGDNDEKSPGIDDDDDNADEKAGANGQKIAENGEKDDEQDEDEEGAASDAGDREMVVDNAADIAEGNHAAGTSKHGVQRDDESDKEWGNMVDDEKEGANEQEH